MNDGIARQTGLLAGVLTLLLRGSAAATPSVVAMAGTMALLTYGILALAPALWRRLSATPSPASPATHGPPIADALHSAAPDAS